MTASQISEVRQFLRGRGLKGRDAVNCVDTAIEVLRILDEIKLSDREEAEIENQFRDRHMARGLLSDAIARKTRAALDTSKRELRVMAQGYEREATRGE
jgi:dTDP-glucose pyrophosphorylase